MRKLWSSLVTAAAQPLGTLATGGAKPQKPAKPKPDHARVALVHTLAERGFDRADIARETGMSQDTVGMLLHLAPAPPADSAGSGTFFRIMQTRLAS